MFRFLVASVHIAWRALGRNRLRTGLTTLGIVIGVAAVIAMVALGSGAQKSVQARIQALGPTLLSIYPGASFRGGIFMDMRISLTVDDYEALARDTRHVKAVVPELTRNLQIKRGNQNQNISIVGTTPNYVQVKNYQVVAGRATGLRRRADIFDQHAEGTSIKEISNGLGLNFATVYQVLRRAGRVKKKRR